jgi:hypothetical protein
VYQILWSNSDAIIALLGLTISANNLGNIVAIIVFLENELMGVVDSKEEKPKTEGPK